MPPRGPEAYQRTSLAIFMRAPPSVRRAALALTIASCAESAAKKSGAGRNGLPVSSPMCRAATAAKRTCVLRPVPTAVPPSASSYSGGSVPSHGPERLIELRDPAADHLTEGHRCRVLQMGAAEHHDVPVLVRLAAQRVAQRDDGGHEHVLDLLDRGDVHDRGEGVVARLPQVDGVVGVDGGVGAARRAGQLVGAVGDHLVGVHVGLRAGSRLEHQEGELGVERAVHDLPGGAGDELGALVREPPELLVGARRRQLEDAAGTDDGPSPAEPLAAGGEVLEGALRLRAPVVLRGDARPVPCCRARCAIRRS